MAAKYRFGMFEFDSVTAELSREGERVRLEAQPAEVLSLLLAHAGDVVTREELRRAVWGSETFVDFDRGLNYCIAQVRAALQDSAQSPRFIRTLPKRGYQFLAPVSPIPGSSPGFTVVEPKIKTDRKMSTVYWTLGAATVLLLLIAGLYAWKAQNGATSARFKIAVMRFDNETGNPGLDRFSDGLTQSLVVDLTTAGGARFGVIGNANILTKPPNERDLIAIGSTLQARYVILGQVQQHASDIRVLVHLIRLPDQTHVWVTRTDFVMDDPLRRESEISKRTVSEFVAHLARDPQPRASLHLPSSH